MLHVQESLMVTGNTLPIVWIRYNPDAYKVNGRTNRTLQVDRHKLLVDTVRRITNAEGTLPPMSIMYLFYDRDGTRPTILDNPEYPETLKSSVLTT